MTRQRKDKENVKTRKRTIRQKGGVSFNQPLSLSQIPVGSYYPLNSYTNDPQHPMFVNDGRSCISGGGKRKYNTKSKRNNKSKRKKILKKKKKSKSSKKYGGIMGLPVISDSVPGSFFSTCGNKYNKNTILAIPNKNSSITSESSSPIVS